MKNELRVFFLLENPIKHLLAVSSVSPVNVYFKLRHLDVVSTKTGLSPCGLDPVFVLKTQGHKFV